MPSVRPNETQSHYMGRCVPYVLKERGTQSTAHAVAKCGGMWRQHLKRVHNVRRRNTLRLDPTRTGMLRLRFMRAIGAGFLRLKAAVTQLVEREDAFGLAARQHTVASLVTHQRYQALTTPQQLAAFQQWLQQQVDQGILRGVDTGARNWMQQYIDEAYRKGAGRSFDDYMKKHADYYKDEAKGYYRGTKDEFLRSAFGRPASVERVLMLATRSFLDLKGVTQAMSAQMNRVLTDGLIQGKSPRVVARELNKVVEGIGRKRALMIARTETIRAHADGQLEALKALGAEEVSVMAEWSTAADDLVCDLCFELDGAVMPIASASGLIPRHPNCRCSWIPANVGEPGKGQLRGKAAQGAIDKSVAGEIPKRLAGQRSVEEQKKLSRWGGAETTVPARGPQRFTAADVKKIMGEAEKKVKPVRKAAVKPEPVVPPVPAPPSVPVPPVVDPNVPVRGIIPEEVHAAVSQVAQNPADLWAGRKTFISDVYQQGGFDQRMSLDEFKKQLLEMRRRMEVTLSQVDLVEGMTAEQRLKWLASEIDTGADRVQLIAVREQAVRAKLPAAPKPVEGQSLIPDETNAINYYTSLSGGESAGRMQNLLAGMQVPETDAEKVFVKHFRDAAAKQPVKDVTGYRGIAVPDASAFDVGKYIEGKSIESWTVDKDVAQGYASMTKAVSQGRSGQNTEMVLIRHEGKFIDPNKVILNPSGKELWRLDSPGYVVRKSEEVFQEGLGKVRIVTVEQASTVEQVQGTIAELEKRLAWMDDAIVKGKFRADSPARREIVKDLEAARARIK